MNPSLPSWVLSATAIMLVIGNVAVRSSRPQVEPLDEITREAVEGQAVTDIAQPANSARQGMAATVSVVESTPPSPANGADLAPLEWAVVETTDYLQYAANLRRLGFPEDLVRAIVIADFNQLYEPREAPLRPRPVPFDAPVGQRQRLLTLDDLERMRQLRDVQLEKQAALQEILGIYVPRELLTTPTSRNYVAYEYALSLLPPEKREAAQLALEDEWLVDDANKHLDRASYVQAYKLTREERNSALTSILTAEEFEQFEMNSNPAGTELARRVIGMEPTDDEFHAMFRIAWDHWVETGGVGGLWRAERVPPEQIAAAEDRMHERLLETLEPDRYLDHQMATTQTGQQLRNFAARYDLPRETLAEAFQLQIEADRLLESLRRPQPPGTAFDPAHLQTRVEDLQQRMESALGPALLHAWMDGRNQRAKLEP